MGGKRNGRGCTGEGFFLQLSLGEIPNGDDGRDGDMIIMRFTDGPFADAAKMLVVLKMAGIKKSRS